MIRLGSVAVTLSLVLALAAGARASEIPDLTADAWMTRIAEALRMGESMSAHAHVDVDKPGRSDDFAFDMQLLRVTDAESRRTVIEMREVGDTKSIVTELIEKPGSALTSWYWDLQKRRWLSVKGLRPTGPWAKIRW